MRPPTFPRLEATISSRSDSSTVRIVPSSTLSAMLPVKPSQTTTSAAPSSRSRPSTLPTNRSSVRRRAARCASRVSRLPFSGSSPIESRPTVGTADADDLLGEDRAHVGELEQVLRAGVGVGAGVDQDRRARGARESARRSPAGSRRAAARSRAARRPASLRCCRPRRRRRPRRARRRGTPRRASCRASHAPRRPASRACRRPAERGRPRGPGRAAGRPPCEPKRIGSIPSARAARAPAMISSGARSPPIASTATRTATESSYGAGASSGSTSRPRYVPQVGQT